MGKIEIELKDWEGLQDRLLHIVDRRLEPIEGYNIRIASIENDHNNCSHETNKRLERIEKLLDSGRRNLWRFAGKGAVVVYRTIGLLALLYIAIKNPELAKAIGGLLP